METSELVLALCQEAGDDMAHSLDTIIDGYMGNHSVCCADTRLKVRDQDINRAASGDAAALVRVRTCCGLPIFV